MPTIQEEIRQIYGADAVCDGVLNDELYRTAPFRILWMLKEPWLDIAWTMLQAEGVYGRIGGSNTLQPMAYVVYSVFNGFPTWRTMDYLRDKPEMAEVLRSIAYLNVKKTVGETRSNDGEVYDWFRRGRDLLQRQVLESQPDIIIGCRPFMRDVFTWFPGRPPPREHGMVTFVAGHPLLIEARHPAQRGIRETYVNELVEVISAGTGS